MSDFLPFRRVFCFAVLGSLAACSTAPQKISREYSPEKSLPPVGQNFANANISPELLLNRLTWGSNFSAYQQMQAVGMDRYLDLQLRNRAAVVPQAVQNQINALTISQKPLDQLIPELEARRIAADRQKGTDDSLRKAYQQELNQLAREAATRSLLRAIYSPYQLQEQMTWFWMNHFNIHSGKHNLRAMLGDFEDSAIRPFALGYFRDLLRATMIHPAMLRYLDNEYNAANHINENYARELMELHTMGVGSGYSQKDVQELARILTGLGVNMSYDKPHVRPELLHLYARRGLFEFNPARHDFGDKLLLGKQIKGRGLAEVDEVIELLVRNPATATFISKKLAQYFVSDEPSGDLIKKMAASFLQSDGNIPVVLRTMFDSPEFLASLGKKFKDPQHYVISAVRLAYDGNTIVNCQPLLNWLNMMGQSPNGHLTPDGYSLQEAAWASPGQMNTRFDIARSIAYGTPGLFKIDGQSSSDKPPAPALASSMFAKSLSKQFSADTQAALTQAKNPGEWNVFFLSSPDMMRR